MKNLIVFDWDGTLLDSLGWIIECIQNSAKDCALKIPDADEIRPLIGLGYERVSHELFPEADQAMHDKVIDVYREYYAAGQ